MAKPKLTPFDAADYLTDENTRLAYIQQAMETRDPAFISRAIGNVAKARGMTAVANDTGLAREALYRSLGTSPNPAFSTVIKVLDSLGLELSVREKGGEVA